jgi:hypothetical protein
MPRKVILGFGISLDGYIARRNGELDFLVIDKEGESLMADFFSKIDTTIMGRKTAAAVAKMRESGEIPETPRGGELCGLPAMEAGQTRGVCSGWRIAENLGEKTKTPPRERHLSGRWGRIGPQFPAIGFGGRALHRTWSPTVRRWRARASGKFPQREFKLIECKSYLNGSVGLRYERKRTKTGR